MLIRHKTAGSTHRCAMLVRPVTLSAVHRSHSTDGYKVQMCKRASRVQEAVLYGRQCQKTIRGLKERDSGLAIDHRRSWGRLQRVTTAVLSPEDYSMERGVGMIHVIAQ